MIKETYVSFKTAILLKEKGFNGWCFGYYKPNREFDTYITPRTYAEVEENYILAPTHQMAMKWLREVHHLLIKVIWTGYEGLFSGDIDNMYNGDWANIDKEYSSYEEAVEESIKYCLTNLI